MKPASLQWTDESNQIGDGEVPLRQDFNDPDTEIPVYRLTSYPAVNSNIYPESPVSSPDGRRFIFQRTELGTQALSYWIADTATRRIRRITDQNEAKAAPIFSPDGTSIYYLAGGLLRRMCPDSFEREDLCPVPPDRRSWTFGLSMARTGLRFIFRECDVPARRFSLGVLDAETGAFVPVFTNPDAPCSHGQFSRNADCRIMFQVNDGMEFDALGNWTRLVGDNGASLHIVDLDGKNHVKLRVGASPLERVQGHQTWVGTTGTVITTLHRRRTPAHPWIQDRIVTLGAEDEAYRIVGEGPGFTHIHTDPGGNYWVSDCNRSACIYLGSIRTGRHRLFCNTGSTFGAPQYTHPHPFFLGDGKSIGWNSDVTGIPHIFFARIPEGFLEELD